MGNRLKSVLILEDEVNTRHLLAKAVKAVEKLKLVADIGSIAEAMSFLNSHDMPDIFLIDLGLPDGSGIELIRCIRKTNPNPVFMVVSIFGDEGNVVDAIEAGATGYIHKDEPLEEISNHLKAVLRGESPISPSIAKHILRRMEPKPAQAMVGNTRGNVFLTSREQDVLKVLARGYSRQEVAVNLEISANTVTTHIKSIYNKLSVHSRTEAIFEAYQLGLISIHD